MAPKCSIPSATTDMSKLMLAEWTSEILSLSFSVYLREKNFTTSIQPAWLIRTDLCSCLGHVQNGCEAMADSLMVFVPNDKRMELAAS